MDSQVRLFNKIQFSIALKSLFQLGFEPLALNVLYKFGLWTGHYKRVGKRETENGQSASAFSSLFTLPTRKDILQTIGKDGEVTLLQDADEIVDGKIRLFGGEPVPLQLTFTEPLHHWADYETHPQLLLNLYNLVPDVKFLWEPARFGWAYILGRAYYVSGKEKYAEAF
jgi:hypothetical protein